MRKGSGQTRKCKIKFKAEASVFSTFVAFMVGTTRSAPILFCPVNCLPTVPVIIIKFPFIINWNSHITSQYLALTGMSAYGTFLEIGYLTVTVSVITFHSYYYISLFVPFFNIAMSLGNLFQRIASIYDRFYLSRLNKLFEEE